MLGSAGWLCCRRFLGLTVGGFKNALHCWNTATSYNVASCYEQGVPVSLQPLLAPFYTNGPFGPSCHGGSLIGAFFNMICYTPAITFTATEVRLRLKFGVYLAANFYTCEVEYRKSRASFWENEYQDGVFLFSNGDVFSFTSDSANFVQSDIGTAAIVQRAWPVDQGVQWAETWSFPLRVEISNGPAPLTERSPFNYESPSTIEFIASGGGFLSGLPTYASAGETGVGLVFLIQRSGFGTWASYAISHVYWEAFSSDGVLTMPGGSVEGLPFPGVAQIAGYGTPSSATTVFTVL
jgi:hypothetical protein